MKQPLRFSIGLTLAFFFFVQFASATNYYVATAAQGGSDTKAGTSLSTPFATITQALTKATVPGDTIFVRSGTYPVSTTVRITQAGTASRHLVLSAYKPDMTSANSRPVFDFSSMSAGSSNRGFLLTAANYWDIYGIVIKGAGDNGMNLGNTSYTTIEFCSFLRNRDTGLQMGGGSHHLKIINCDSYENADLGPGTTSSGGNADGYAPKLDVGDSILFRGCRAWMNSDDGWDGYMRSTSDNKTTFLEDCWAFHNGYYWLNGSTTPSQNGNGFKMGGSDGKDQAHNFVLTKCVAFHNKANGFDQNNNTGSIYLYNCSGYANKGSDYGLNSPNITYRTDAKLVLKNNLSLGEKGVNIPTGNTGNRTLISVTNSFKTAATSTEILSLDTSGATGARNIDGSLPSLDFMKLNTSALPPLTYIDKGTILSDVKYYGQMGIPYNGTAPDLGAFESSKGIVNGIYDNTEMSSYALKALAFPDPFQTTLTFRYDVPSSTNVSLVLLDQMGKVMKRILQDELQSGTQEVFLDSQELSRGLYYLKLTVGNETITKPILKQ